MSQAALAELIEVTPSYVGLLERGERIPSLDVLLTMCAAVRLSPAELFADARPPTATESPEIAQLRALLEPWPPAHRKAVVKIVKELGRLRED